MSFTAVLGICIIAAVTATLLKSYKPEYAMLVAVVAGAAVLISVVFDVMQGLLTLRNTFADYGISTSYFFVAVKALGICLITGFIADICRDAGQAALASKAELAGRCAVFVLSVPLLLSLLQTAYGFIG